MLDTKSPPPKGTTPEVVMNEVRTDTLKIPSTTLHYEVVGSGPVLLLIPGGPMDADGFAPLRNVLSDRYTVVTYDPRGLSHSRFDGEPEDMTVQAFADDAHKLLAALTSEPAFVLGSSGGALVGLELAAKYPQQVRALVAHEPPLDRLLGDAEAHDAFNREVYDTYRAEGVGPAMSKFLAAADLDGDAPHPPADPTPELAEAIARMHKNMDFFLAHMWMPLGSYSPDISRFRSLSVTVAVGEASEGQLAYRAAAVLAEQLGSTPVVFPGDHGGFSSDPEAFASRLHEVLSAY